MCGNMSRIGKQTVDIPETVKVKITSGILTAEASGKKMEYPIPECLKVEVEGNELKLIRKDNEQSTRALHGLSRTLIKNMMIGLSEGFSKKLEMVGRGKRAKVEGSKLILELGFSHPIEYELPKGIEAIVERTIIEIKGYDKQQVGETAAKLRGLQPPEPYKGAGIRYLGEHIRRKAGKSAIGGGIAGS